MRIACNAGRDTRQSVCTRLRKIKDMLLKRFRYHGIDASDRWQEIWGRAELRGDLIKMFESAFESAMAEAQESSQGGRKRRRVSCQIVNSKALWRILGDLGDLGGR